MLHGNFPDSFKTKNTTLIREGKRCYRLDKPYTNMCIIYTVNATDFSTAM